MNDNIATPFAKPLYVMLKPAGAHCNLACKYCYYLEKNHLYQNTPRHLMTDEMLEQFTREYIEAHALPPDQTKEPDSLPDCIERDSVLCRKWWSGR